MSEFYIVLSHPVDELETLGEAMARQQALQSHVPEREHKIYRCKSYLAGARHFTKSVELLADIQREGLTDQNRDRLRLLLGTISHRTPKLRSLTQVDGPPEFGARP